jgi:hypothetical protein
MNELKNVINPATLPDVKCMNVISKDPNLILHCGSILFTQQFRIKKVSKFISGNGQEGIAVIPVYVCSKCGCELDITKIKP